MVTLVTLYTIIKVAATLLSLVLGGRKLYKWIRRKLSKRKPTV
ncbi:hypothetical protein [Brevibacillus brevis]|nr:hypothetical protein [Brevibacillus brevis]